MNFLKLRKVTVNAGKIGLVFKGDAYQRVIKEGINWIALNERVVMYDMTLSFTSNTVKLDVLLQNKELVALWHVIEVADNELVVVYKNGLYSIVLTAGRYVYWKGLVDYEFVRVDLSKIYITENIEVTLLNNYDLSKFVRVFEVAAYEKAVLLVDDVYVKTLSGGTYRFWRNNSTVKIAKVDMRARQLEVSGQELLTKDKAAVRMSLFAQFTVVNVEKAILENKDYEKQLYTALQLALRAYVGAYTLDELLENKTSLGAAVLETTVATAATLGMELSNVGVRDIILTGEMKEIMNKVLVAQKTAQANVITRREETASTRSLLNTAKLMEENEMLFKLKEMEYVEKIADKIGEITVTGNGGVVKQLKEIFAAGK